MALSVGIDLVVIEDIRRALRDHADRYVARVYTDGEARRARDAGDAGPALLAGCFAAKEAVVKALGAEVPPRSVELTRAGGLRLTGPAATQASTAGLDHWSVTIGGASGYACAVVVARGAA